MFIVKSGKLTSFNYIKNYKLFKVLCLKYQKDKRIEISQKKTLYLWF